MKLVREQIKNVIRHKAEDLLTGDLPSVNVVLSPVYTKVQSPLHQPLNLQLRVPILDQLEGRGTWRT